MSELSPAQKAWETRRKNSKTSGRDAALKAWNTRRANQGSMSDVVPGLNIDAIQKVKAVVDELGAETVKQLVDALG